jgi:DDE superfamily endonuclease
MQTQDRPYRSADIVRFLRLLLRRIRGPLLVIWDGASIHTGQPVCDFLAQGAAWGLLVARLPGYAPDLNPDEGAGTTSSASSWATCAAPISRSWLARCGGPRSACATNGRSSKLVSGRLAIRFSRLRKPQYGWQRRQDRGKKWQRNGKVGGKSGKVRAWMWVFHAVMPAAASE